MKEQFIPIVVPERLRPQNKEGKDCDCMSREYLLKYKHGLLNWVVFPQQQVRQGQVIAEAEIDKRIFEIPSPADGILAQCLVEDDAEFSCKQILGYVRCDD